MSGNLPVSGLEPITQPVSIGDLMIISQQVSSGFMSAQIPVGEFLSQLFSDNSEVGDKLGTLATELTELEHRVDVLETNPAVKDFVDKVFHVGSKHMTTNPNWNPGEALRPFFGKRTNWVLYPHVPAGVVSEDVPLGTIVPLLQGSGTSTSNLRIWERLPDNSGNYLVTIKPNKTAINEGDEVQFSITMVGVEPGTLIDYQILGIDESDLDATSEAKLVGSFINSSSGAVNTLTLKTVPNRRTDGDRTITLVIPSYQGSGSVTLIDTSKTLDGVINVLPGTSQVITLAPNQQADVWVTGAGGSGGVSKSSIEQVATEANLISKSVLAGTTETISLQPGEEVEVWLWGGGADSGGAWVATAPIPTSEYGNGEASKVVIGNAVFTAGGGYGYTESAMAVKDGIRYAANALPGGANSIVSGDYNGLEVTVLENVNGNAGGISRTHTSATWGVTQSLDYGAYSRNDIDGMMHGAGATGHGSASIADTAYSTSTYRIEGGGAGGFLKLRVKNPTRGTLTFQSTAGKAGKRYDATNLLLGMSPNMRYTGNGGLDGVVQIVIPTTKEVVHLKSAETKNITIPAGKSAEIWVIGSGGAGNTGVNSASQGDASSITIGSAKYIAGGGGVSTYLPGSSSGGAESYPIPGKTTVPTSGLPANVTVEILENREGYPTTIKKNEHNVWTNYLTKDTYVKGYGPFAGIGYSEAFNIMMSPNRAPAAGAVLGLKVTNNGSTPLIIPAVVAKQSIADIFYAATPGVKTDEYESGYRAHGGYGAVLAFINDSNSQTSSGGTTSTDIVKVTDTTSEITITIPANFTMDIEFAGGGGGGGAMVASPRTAAMYGKKGGDTILKIGSLSFVAGGGGGGTNIAGLSDSDASGRFPGAGGTNVIPALTGLPAGITVEIIENLNGETPPVDPFDATTQNVTQRGGSGWGFAGVSNVGGGGGSNHASGSLYWTSAGGGSGGKIKLRVKNENPTAFNLLATIGAKGAGGVSTNPNGYPGFDGILAYSQVIVTQESAGYNGQWSYVAFQSPLITDSGSPYIDEIYWAADEAGTARLDAGVPYGDHAYLIVKTVDVNDSVILTLSADGLTQEEMGGGLLGQEVTIPITKVGNTNKGIGHYLIQTLDDDEMSFRNSKWVSYEVGTERKKNTEYRNTSNYTIVLSIISIDPGYDGAFKIRVGDEWPVVINDLYDADQQFSVIVPPNETYYVDAGVNGIRKWSELRYKGIK